MPKTFYVIDSWANVIKLFTAVSYDFFNKLQRLSLASSTRVSSGLTCKQAGKARQEQTL